MVRSTGQRQVRFRPFFFALSCPSCLFGFLVFGKSPKTEKKKSGMAPIGCVKTSRRRRRRSTGLARPRRRLDEKSAPTRFSLFFFFGGGRTRLVHTHTHTFFLFSVFPACHLWRRTNSRPFDILPSAQRLVVALHCFSAKRRVRVFFFPLLFLFFFSLHWIIHGRCFPFCYSCFFFCFRWRHQGRERVGARRPIPAQEGGGERDR